MNGLTVVPSGKFLKIRQARAAQRDSLETYTGEYFPNTDQIITRIIKLKYISADEVFKNLRILNSKDGESHAYAPTNSLIITDYGSQIERVVNILRYLDVSGFEEKLAVIRIKFAKAKDIAELINKIINKDAGSSAPGIPRFRRTTSPDKPAGGGAESYSLVVSDDRTNSLIVVGNDAGIKKIKILVSQLDFRLRPEDAGGVHVYYVRHGEAEKIANVLGGIASESKKSQQDKGGSNNNPSFNRSSDNSGGISEAVFGGDVKVTADKDTNSLIITASKQDYEVVKNILSKIDIARDQVFVKTVIMEMSAEKKMDWGVNYYQFDKNSKGMGRVGFRGTSNLQDLINPAGDSGAIFGFGSGEQFDINIGGATTTVSSLVGLVKLLQGNVGGNILSTPQIMAMDNEEATIEVGEEVPVGRKDTTTGSSVTSGIERKEATIKLVLTPYISPDTDSVRMKIDQQVKQVSNRQVQAKDLADSSVVLNTRTIKTTLVVDSGDTAALGGLMNNSESEEVNKVPILGDIPIIGWLFKSRSVKSAKTNLLVFITPRIIRNTEDNSEVFNNKLDERISFIQRHMGGRDPYGSEIDNLPRKASAPKVKEELVPSSDVEIKDTEDSYQPESPAVESF
ncbi:MAG: type II secretion system secretin GspD [Bdellovibrionaceae bacterium]|nr:type II secretion system secretin GspD [Pseudobdellovibrionaceae bacterium]